MTTFLPYTTAICYRSGLDIGGYLTWFFYNMPITVWYLLAGVAFYSSDVYIQLLSSSYWLNLGIATILQESSESARPYPNCNNQGYGLPAWEVSLAYHYIVMMAWHRLINTHRLGLFDLFRGVLIGVIVPVVLGISGNYSVWQMVTGAFVGTSVGVYVMFNMTTFWVDRLAFVTKDAPILNHWGFRNGAQSFYTDKEVALATPQQEPDPTAARPLLAQEPESADADEFIASQVTEQAPPPSFMEELVLGDPFTQKGQRQSAVTAKNTRGGQRVPVLGYHSSIPVSQANGLFAI